MVSTESSFDAGPENSIVESEFDLPLDDEPIGAHDSLDEDEGDKTIVLQQPLPTARRAYTLTSTT